jgi:tetratricopeptide (TPR) repeat protein
MKQPLSKLNLPRKSTEIAKIFSEFFVLFCGKNLHIPLRCFVVSILLFGISNANAAEWVKAYKKGDYTNAFQTLEKTVAEFPDIGNYNRGNILYRQKDFQGSEKAFATAAALTENDKLKEKALYNRGTALLAATPAQTNAVYGSAARAADLFEQALTIDPKDSVAKQNFERAINLAVTSRINTAAKLIQEADAMLKEFKAKTAKENYTTVKPLLAPVLSDLSSDNQTARDLTQRATDRIAMLNQAVNDTRAELEAAKKAVAAYEYKKAADLMLDDKPERKWAFDLDEKLAQEFQQFNENNHKVIEIVYPSNPLKP